MQVRNIEVNINRFGQLKDNNRTPSENNAGISYQGDAQRLNAITPEFITEAYDIPREGPYCKTARPRSLVLQFVVSPRIQEAPGPDRPRRARGFVIPQARSDRRLPTQQQVPYAYDRSEERRQIRASADRARA